jgi:surfeit locus 1 family protein
MVAFVALAIAAGNWQRSRMHGKEALRAQFDAHAVATPGPLPVAPAGGDWTAERFRPVAVRGEFDAAHQIYLDNRVHAGRAGYHVVAPLRLTDGRVVLVDRGFVAAGATRAALPPAPPPKGEVPVQGRVDLPGAYFELKAETPSGPVWQNLDPVRFAAATGVPVLPAIIEQTVPPTPDDGLARVWPAPDFGVDKHRIYMWQWYSFAALAVILWIVLNVRRHRRTGDG